MIQCRSAPTVCCQNHADHIHTYTVWERYSVWMSPQTAAQHVHIVVKLSINLDSITGLTFKRTSLSATRLRVIVFVVKQQVISGSHIGYIWLLCWWRRDADNSGNNTRTHSLHGMTQAQPSGSTVAMIPMEIFPWRNVTSNAKRWLTTSLSALHPKVPTDKRTENKPNP